MVRLAYLWASPNSLLGACCALLARGTGGQMTVYDGVLEASGGIIGTLLPRLPAGPDIMAITLGHVVLGTTQSALEQTRTHERVHVRQYERWGPFFIPAYLASSTLALLRGGDPYHDNHFEREAFAHA